MKKLLSVMAAVALLLACCVFSASADDVIWLTTDFDASASAPGPWFAKFENDEVAAGEGNQLIVTDTTGEGGRVLWAWPEADYSGDYHFFLYEVFEAAEGAKLTVSNNAAAANAAEFELDITPGEHCICISDITEGQTSIGYQYVIAYPGANGSITFAGRLSAVDDQGNIYVKPTQPPVPNGKKDHMIRKELPAYTEDHVEEDTGYSWLMSVDAATGVRNVDCIPDESGKGFTLRRSEDSEAGAVNIAWVVPDAWLAQTPYLVIEVGNEGRPDEGPQIAIYSYWEHVVGSVAAFDNMGLGYHGANGLNGVNAFNLKYAVDNVDESLHGEDGIAIILGLDLSKARSDGTVLDDLVIKDAYLMGWEEGYEGSGLFIEEMYEDDNTTPTSRKTAAPTQAYGTDDESKFPIVPVAIGAGALVVIAVVVAIIVSKKKKK